MLQHQRAVADHSQLLILSLVCPTVKSGVNTCHLVSPNDDEATSPSLASAQDLDVLLYKSPCFQCIPETLTPQTYTLNPWP